MAASLCTSQVINNKLSEFIRRRICLKSIHNSSYASNRLLFNLGIRTISSESLSRGDRLLDLDTSDNSPAGFFFSNDCGKVCRKAYERTPNIRCHILRTGKNVCGKDRVKKVIMTSQRRWNSSSGKPERSLPPLMDFPEIVWPSVIKTIRNRILSSFIITPYFDREFGLSDFVHGSKQAVQCVSNYLSRGDYKSLEGLITDDALKEVKKNIATFNVEQRHELYVNKEDIYFSFPYQIGIMFNDDDKNQQRFVEITMVYHVLRGLKEMRAQDINPPLNLGMLPEYQDKIHLCNYRFIREFTKGVDNEWTINVLNHFKPIDQVKS